MAKKPPPFAIKGKGGKAPPAATPPAGGKPPFFRKGGRAK
jgi:hypothetical protein